MDLFKDLEWDEKIVERGKRGSLENSEFHI